MPTYDYACVACGHRFEVVHGVHDHGPEACPKCAGGPVRRAFAPPTVVFKGSGWAKVDRRSGHASPKKAPADGDTAAPTSESESGTAASPSSEGGSAAPTTTAD